MTNDVTRRWKSRAMGYIPEDLQVALFATRAHMKSFHHIPNIVKPRSFNEKVCRRKIMERDPRFPVLADKVLVKDIVRAKLGDDWIIPTIWHGQHLPPVEERTWPMPFVIKVNSGSGWNIFVRNEAECDWPDIERRCDEWMRTTFGRHLGEWLYAHIKPQILVEPFIGKLADLPLDYKFWTFGGKVKAIQVDTDREHSTRRRFYDPDWRPLPFAKGVPLEERDIPRPVSLDRMIAAAEILAEDISFVRVDFYEIEDSPVFGEMTFYPASGISHFSPSEWDEVMGSYWQ